MAHINDITGMRFGKLTVKQAVGKYNRETIWRCVCDCGKETDIRIGHLRSGNTRSCGCGQGVRYE